jgi:hypothetical protein
MTIDSLEALPEVCPIGRDLESGRIDAFVDGVGGGPCGLTMAGPAGIGKTHPLAGRRAPGPGPWPHGAAVRSSMPPRSDT